MDVFGLSRHEYLQPPLPKHGRQQQTGSGGSGSSGGNANSGNNQQSGKFISNIQIFCDLFVDKSLNVSFTFLNYDLQVAHSKISPHHFRPDSLVI